MPLFGRLSAAPASKFVGMAPDAARRLTRISERRSSGAVDSWKAASSASSAAAATACRRDIVQHMQVDRETVCVVGAGAQDRETDRCRVLCAGQQR